MLPPIAFHPILKQRAGARRGCAPFGKDIPAGERIGES
jgi:hypothetical protein